MYMHLARFRQVPSKRLKAVHVPMWDVRYVRAALNQLTYPVSASIGLHGSRPLGNPFRLWTTLATPPPHKKKKTSQNKTAITAGYWLGDWQLPLCCCKVSLGIYGTCIWLPSASILYYFILCANILFIKYTYKICWNPKWCPFLWDSRQAAMQYGHARVSPVNWQNTLISCILIWTEPWKNTSQMTSSGSGKPVHPVVSQVFFQNTCETAGCTGKHGTSFRRTSTPL